MRIPLAGRVTVVTVLALISLTSGHRSFQDMIPNGDRVPHPCRPGVTWDGVGHTNVLGGGSRNAFGIDFDQQGSSWTKALCEKDSDGDGMTNGFELGDPGCTWTQGTPPTRNSNITHPGVCDPWEDPKCNNSWVDCSDDNTFKCDALHDRDTQNITFRIPATPVPDDVTRYTCMTFDLPADDAYHLIATMPVIDNADVVHHMILHACEDDSESLPTPTECGMAVSETCSTLVAVWYPSIPGVCHNNRTGFQFGWGAGLFKRLRLQIHWYNPELISGQSDSSGMTIFYTSKPGLANAASVTVGQDFLEIPAGQPDANVTGMCSADCTNRILTEPIYVTMALNNMYYLGIEQKIEVLRNGSVVAVITDEKVHPGSPVAFVHDDPIEIRPGDEVRTTCVYDSSGRDTTTYYTGNIDGEVCLGHMVVYPKEALAVTTKCMGHKENSLCQAETFPVGVDGCDFLQATNTSDPAYQWFESMVTTACQPFAPCLENCKRLWDIVKERPCFKPRNFETLKQIFFTDLESTLMFAGLDSCRRLPEVPECPACPELNCQQQSNTAATPIPATTDTTDGDRNGPSSVAVSVLPATGVTCLLLVWLVHLLG